MEDTDCSPPGVYLKLFAFNWAPTNPSADDNMLRIMLEFAAASAWTC